MEKLIRDGVALAHETRGQADPPILLVYRWTSMGGVIAFEVAARHPGLPGAVVAVDCPPDAVRGAIQPVIDGVISVRSDRTSWPMPSFCPPMTQRSRQVNPMIDRFLTISVSGDA